MPFNSTSGEKEAGAGKAKVSLYLRDTAAFIRSHDFFFSAASTHFMAVKSKLTLTLQTCALFCQDTDKRSNQTGRRVEDE